MDAVTVRLEQLRSVHHEQLVVMSGMAGGFNKLIAVTALKLRILLSCQYLLIREYVWRFQRRKSDGGDTDPAANFVGIT
jgi:hypothetical protein